MSYALFPMPLMKDASLVIKVVSIFSLEETFPFVDQPYSRPTISSLTLMFTKVFKVSSTFLDVITFPLVRVLVLRP